ncbi:MAG: hypothetical protein AAB276_05370, partial [Pseudomonadota bacterium]
LGYDALAEMQGVLINNFRINTTHYLSYHNPDTAIAIAQSALALLEIDKVVRERFPDITLEL